MMPQLEMGGILILMIFAAIFFIVPIILFFVMIYKVRKRAVDWQGIFASDDLKQQMGKSNERVDRFANKIEELLDIWIADRKKEKEK